MCWFIQRIFLIGFVFAQTLFVSGQLDHTIYSNPLPTNNRLLIQDLITCEKMNLMKKLFFSIIAVILFAHVCHAQSSATWSWGKADAADVTAGNLAVSQHVAAASGNKVLWGMLQNLGLNFSSFYFGNYKLTEYDNFGNAGSSATITGKLYLSAAQADAAGNWYVLGQYFDTVNFRGGPTFINTMSSSTTPSFLFKLNRGTLSLAWARQITQEASVTAFSVCGSGVYVAVDSEWTTICKYDLATGNRTDLFSQQFRSSTSSLAVDSTGNIYIAGSCAFSGLNFNGHVVTTSIAYPVYIVKYKPDGTYSWHHLLADVTCTGRQLTVANNNSIYYSGRIFDTFTFGGFTLHHPAWVYDYLVSRLDSSGNVLWVKQQKDTLAGDANVENINHAVAMSDGSLSVFATLRGYLDWGNGLTTNEGINDNVAIVNYAASGEVNWIKPVSALQTNAANIAGNGTDIWVTGNVYDSSEYTIGSITIPVAPVTYTPFMAKLHTAPVTSSVADVEESNGVQVMPVPATNLLTVKLPPETHDTVHIQLTDIAGRKVAEKTADGNNLLHQLDVSMYSRGLYFIEISGNGFHTVKKIVLQ